MAWGGVGRCVAERDGNGARRAVKRLDRSPAPAPPTSSYPHSSVGSAQGLLLSQLLSEAAHPGLRAGSARLQFSRESERVFLPLGFLYPGLHFPRPAPRKPAFSLPGNKCTLLVAVPAVTKAATGAQRGRARTGGERRRPPLPSPTGFSVQPSSLCGLCRPRFRPTLLPGLGRQGTSRLRTRSFLLGKPGSSPLTTTLF